MKKPTWITLVFGIFFLFLLQSMGCLVESIYILDLLKTSLDEKALSLLFFFAPVILFVLPRKPNKVLIWTLFGLVFLGRGFIPYLPTLGRMFSSGIATSAGLVLFAFLLTSYTHQEDHLVQSKWIAVGLVGAVLASIFLRTWSFSLDISLQREGGWIGWGLGLLMGLGLKHFNWEVEEKSDNNAPNPTLPVLGIMMVISLALFAFSAPAVIARWSDMDYRLIIGAVSGLAFIWALVELDQPQWLEKIPPFGIILWNGLFTLSLSGTLLALRVPFPPTPASPPVIIAAPSVGQQILMLITILLFPVLFMDMRLLYERLQQSRPAAYHLAGGMLLGSFGLVLLIFMQIFTNVWGYVEPVSPWFRNKFWLPYLLMAALLTIIVGQGKLATPSAVKADEKKITSIIAIGLALLCLGSIAAAFWTTRLSTFKSTQDSLVVMTYNIQQANDSQGERSFQRQLAWIEKISPDILALQESDSARISLNNVDIVRYFAGKLGYYSFYGPSPVSGTYGTAILSKYPLYNQHVIYSYSDKDEIATSVAEIHLDGKVFTIYNVHPDGSDLAMQVFAQTLLEQVDDKQYVLALGDYNLRDDEAPYRLIAERLINAWESLYPTKISPDGTDMSGRNRIDHIFLSPPLKAIQAVYILPPESATDHPLHWAEIIWAR